MRDSTSITAARSTYELLPWAASRTDAISSRVASRSRAKLGPASFSSRMVAMAADISWQINAEHLSSQSRLKAVVSTLVEEAYARQHRAARQLS